MGCYESMETVNVQLRQAIKNFEFKTINIITSRHPIFKLDPTLIHEAVKTGHIELIELFLVNSKINQNSI